MNLFFIRAFFHASRLLFYGSAYLEWALASSCGYCRLVKKILGMVPSCSCHNLDRCRVTGMSRGSLGFRPKQEERGKKKKKQALHFFHANRDEEGSRRKQKGLNSSFVTHNGAACLSRL